MVFDVSILHTMLSADNSHRRAAEAAYSQCLQSPEDVAQGLLSNLPVGSQPDNVRIMAAVLLRQLVDKKREHWDRLSPQARDGVRSSILQLVFTEPTAVISNRIAHCVAQVASSEPWPALLHTVCGYVAVGDEPARIAMFILTQLPEYAPNMMCGNALSLLPVYSEALQSPNMKLQIGGLKATGALLLALPSDKERAPFTPLVVPILAALSNALSTNHELEAQEVLTALVEVAQNAVDFFRTDLSSVLDAMLTVASSEDSLEFDTRERALEVIVTLCQESPARMRRCRNILQVIPVTHTFMCAVDVDEDEDWVGAPYNADHFVDDDEDYLVGDQGMEHILEALGKGLLPATLELALGQNLQSTHWPHRRASLALIGACSTAHTKSMKPHLATCCEALVNGAQDAHPRVKFTAITQIALFCEHFTGEFQRLFHAQVVPTLAQLIGDASQCSRVRAHAAACMVNFAKASEADYVIPYSDEVLGALALCFQPGVGVDVQAEALGAVSCVAEVTETKFERYYSCFMPGILGLLEGEMSSRLRGKALQCVGVMGTSVGLTLFQNDAVKVLELLMPSMSCDGGVFPEGYFEYLAPACASIAKALGPHFTQFLPTVIPPLLHTLNLTVEVSVKEFDGDLNESEDPSYDEASGFQSTVLDVKGRGQMRVTMNTTAVMEKQLAAKTIYEYAECLNEHMLDFIEPCISACIPLVVFRYSEDVRGSASFAVGKLFASAVKAVMLNLKPRDFAAGLLPASVQALTVGIAGERHHEPMCCMSEALRDLLQACFESQQQVLVTGPEATGLCQKLLTAVGACLKKRDIKSAEFQESDELEEDDIERLEEELEEEEELMTNLVDCIGYLLKGQTEANAVSMFDHMVAPVFTPLMSPDQPSSLRHNALCLYDDMVEFGGTEAEKYIPQLAPILVSELGSPEPYLQQVSAYGVMQVAKKFSPQCFSQMFQNSFVVQKLVMMLSSEEATDPAYELAMENVVACLGAIAGQGCVANEQEQNQIFSLWLSKLPLRADEVEAKVVHKQLCDLIEGGHPAIIGDEFKALNMVLGIFAQLLESAETLDCGLPDSILDLDTRNRIVALTRQIQSQVSTERVQGAWATLTEEQQGAVQRALCV